MSEIRKINYYEIRLSSSEIRSLEYAIHVSLGNDEKDPSPFQITQLEGILSMMGRVLGDLDD